MAEAASTISWAAASAATASTRVDDPALREDALRQRPAARAVRGLRASHDDARFAAVAHGIVRWLVREMRAPDGAFYSSLDADSEGHEGKFYVWQRDEVRTLLSPEAYAVAAPYYGLDGPPNFEGHAWNLRVTEELPAIAATLGIPVADAEARLEAAKAALFAARESRVRAGPRRQDPDLVERACDRRSCPRRAGARCARVGRPCRGGDRRAAPNRMARWPPARHAQRRPRASQCLPRRLRIPPGGAHRAHQTRFRLVDYAWARELADILLTEFEDLKDGGFFFTSHDHEQLFHRTKPGHDNATPSGNAVAAGALIALGHLCAEPRYVLSAERAVRLYAPAMARSPAGFSTMLAAEADVLSPPTSVLLAGDAQECGAGSRRSPPGSVPTFAFSTWRASTCRPGSPRARLPPAGAAWVCQGTQCLPAIDDLAPARGDARETLASRPMVNANRQQVLVPFVRFSPTLSDGASMKIAAVILVAGVLATGAARAADSGEELMKKDGCTACHSIDKKVVGRRTRSRGEVPRRRERAAKLAEKVKKGGSGVWGPVPMPPNAAVSDADIKTLVAYILALK
jgi:cytochrome c551/c552